MIYIGQGKSAKETLHDSLQNNQITDRARDRHVMQDDARCLLPIFNEKSNPAKGKREQF